MVLMVKTESSPRERTLNKSRITDWQQRNRQHVRRKLKESQDERVDRNKANRILNRSSRKKVCYVVNCNVVTGLRADHINKNTSNNSLSTLKKFL